MRPQRVRHQTSRVNVSPGQRTDVNDQQLKRLSIGRQRVREFRLTLIFRSVKTGEPRVQVSGCRRCSLRWNIPNHRRIPCCRNGRGGGTARGGHGCRRLTGWPQREARTRQRQNVKPDHNRDDKHRHPDPLRQEQPGNQQDKYRANHLPVNKALNQIEHIVRTETCDLGALAHNAFGAG